MVYIAIHSLQGALGKTSGRSYKAAPRQLLQVDGGNPGASPTMSHAHAHISNSPMTSGGAAKEAAKLGREALGNAAADVRWLAILLLYIHAHDLVALADRKPCSQGPSDAEADPCFT